MKRENNLEDIVFEERDVQIFNIPDIKTRLSTLQNYFFPRLEILLRYTLDIVQDVYGVNPYERMTFVYRPNHRINAKENMDLGMVYIGVSAKRSNKPLKILNGKGQPFVFHPTYLTIKVLPTGTMHIELRPFTYHVDDAYIKEIAALFEKYSNILLPLLSLTHVSYSSFLLLHESITPENRYITLVSPRYYFPLGSGRGFDELIIAFTLLYALAESFTCIGEGRESEIERMLEQFKDWYVKLGNTEDETAEKGTNLELPEIPELDSYSFVRTGKALSRK